MRLSLSAAALFVALALSARASEAQAPSTSQRDAETQFREGVTLFEQREFVRAAEAFGAAWELTHEERFLWNEALSELNAGRYVEAAKHLAMCRAMPASSGEHAMRINAALGDARAHVTLFEISAPAGAVVKLDGEPVETAPLAMLIPAEPNAGHTVSASLGGAETSQSFMPQGVRTVPVVLVPPPPNAPSTKAISADSEPPREGTSTARVAVAASLLGMMAAAGGLSILFYANAGSDSNRLSTLSQQAPLVPNQPSNARCYQVTSQICSDIRTTVDAVHANDNRSLGFGIAGGVLGVAAVATWLLWPTAKAASATQAVVVPEIDPTRLGASLVMRY